MVVVHSVSAVIPFGSVPLPVCNASNSIGFCGVNFQFLLPSVALPDLQNAERIPLLISPQNPEQILRGLAHGTLPLRPAAQDPALEETAHLETDKRSHRLPHGAASTAQPHGV